MPVLRRLVCLLLLVLAPLALEAQGEIRESLSLESKVLKRTMRYSIYLPSGYESSKRTFPVTYLLHGFSDDDTAWIHYGEVGQTLDRAIAAREITPMIVVMPDGLTSWYVNSHEGALAWEDYFIREFIPYLESRFRIRAHRQARGLAGLSMGGHGTLLMAARHSQLFGAAAALSPAVFTREGWTRLPQEAWDRMFAPVFGAGLQGEARLTAHQQANDPLRLLASLPAEDLRRVRFYLDCGDQDSLLDGVVAVHQVMQTRQIPHALRVRGGGHTWSTWRSALLPALGFLSDSYRLN